MGGYRQVNNAKKPSIASRNNSSSAENYYLFFKTLPVGDDTIELKMVAMPQCNQIIGGLRNKGWLYCIETARSNFLLPHRIRLKLHLGILDG